MDFIKTPLGVALVAIAFSVSSNWLGDKLGLARESSAQVVKLDTLDKRVTQTQSDLLDLQRGALTAAQFQEFRTANERRLDDIREDLKLLETDIRARR